MGPSQALKAIALELGKKSGRNEFDGVYGEFYRRFEIPGYRELLARRFEEAMGFLREWSVAVVERDGRAAVLGRREETVLVFGGGRGVGR